MRRLFQAVAGFVREDFAPWKYGIVFVFLAASIPANYTFDFENNFLRRQFGSPLLIVFYFFFYSIPYVFVLAICAISDRTVYQLRSATRIVQLLLLFVVLSLNGSLYVFYVIGTTIEPPLELARFSFKCLALICYALVFFIPLSIIRYAYRRSAAGLVFGLSRPGYGSLSYAIMAVIPVSLAFIASYNESFLEVYPTFEAGEAATFLDVATWKLVAIYEALYGLHFIAVEMFFRGALVVALAGWLGRSCVLPMVVVYAFWHFGKPIGETVSSVFGGYILGALAYSTRNIWGGIILHIGTAFSMEGSAFFQKSILK